ncbi:hypothetical protein [Rubritalea tangerina]|uniref:hypothetical protein n=1 Tax=Rubritalea tangerina TaxID=430798 RepID=UPI0036095836
MPCLGRHPSHAPRELHAFYHPPPLPFLLLPPLNPPPADSDLASPSLLSHTLPHERRSHRCTYR